MKDRTSIGIVRFPASSAGSTPLANLVDICNCIKDQVYVISGNEAFEGLHESVKIDIFRVDHDKKSYILYRALKYFLTQAKITVGMIKKNEVKDYIFFWSGFLFVPLLVGKLLRKNISIALMGKPFGYDSEKEEHMPIVQLCLSLSDNLIIYAPNLIAEWGMEEYSNKIKIAHRHIIDFDSFQITKKIHERNYEIGYIGRFAEVKNVLGFVHSIPHLLTNDEDLNVFLGGDGSQKGDVLDFMEKNELGKNIHYEGWIDHDDLPKFLNDIKLLVIPSHSEGLPNMMLEAMACGTPVLISPVGAVPDIIKDGKNGFILEDNSPEGIAKRVNEIMECDNDKINKIIVNANEMVRDEFSFKKVVEKFRTMLQNI